MSIQSLRIVDNSSIAKEINHPASLFKKPLSLKVHEIGVPILKALTVLLGMAAESAFAFSLEGIVLGDLPVVVISSIVFVATALLGIGIYFLHKKMSSKLREMKDPEWIAYFSAVYRNRPIEDLMKALPNRKAWLSLQWTGADWKEKILPFAKAHQLDRRGLKDEFKKLFPRFDAHLTDYYREIEIALLHNEGFQALMDRSILSLPAAVTPQELRAQLLKETSGLSEHEAIEKVGQLPFYRGYLTVEDFSKMTLLKSG